MRILVTGADGFLGQHLVSRLLDTGDRVTAAALTLPPSRTILSSEDMSAVDWKAADVRDRDALFRLLAAVQPDHLYHLAGFASGGMARQRAAEAVEVNVEGTVNLFEAALAVQEEFPDFRPRVLVMGAGESYGDSRPEDGRLTEDVPLRPVSVYGMSKAAQELVAHTYRRAYGIKTVVVRGFNMVGPGQEAVFVVPNFCRQAAAVARGERDPVIHVGNLDVIRDFSDVRDGAAAFRTIMALEDPEGAYNVCSGEGTRVGTILEWILDESGVEAEVRVDPERVREEEVPRMVGDPSRLREQTGWAPQRDLEETVRGVYRWMVSNEQA